MGSFFDSRDLNQNQSCLTLSRSVIPLQRSRDKNRNLEVFGSGVLFFDGERHFILTAKHVFDDFERDAIYLSAILDEATGRNSLRADAKDIYWGFIEHDDWDLGAMHIPEEQVAMLLPFQSFATIEDFDFISTVSDKTVLVFIGFPVQLNSDPPIGRQVHLPVGAIHPSHYSSFGINSKSEIAGFYDPKTAVIVDSDECGGVDPTGMSGGLVLAGELVNDSLKDVKFKIKGIGSNFSENGKNIVGLNFIDSAILDGLKGITNG